MKRNKFSLSNYKLLTCDMGELVPIGCQEVLPGDTFQHATQALIRVSPLLSPVMHPTHVKIHHWFVPHRIVWEDFEDFITGGPDNTSAPAFPQITSGAGGFAEGSLADYLGAAPPIGGGTPQSVSALPFRAYAKIWNEFYRDQDLQTELTVDIGSGSDTTTNTTLQNAAWGKDYFTTARPWAQKGGDVVVPVERASNAANWSAFIAGTDTVAPAGAVTTVGGSALLAANGSGASLDPNGGLFVGVDSLREAMAIQRYDEARARYGSRYTEYLRYLGVKSSDARLQRPEYLGGGKQTIQFSEVLATAETGTSVDVGDMKGHGISAVRSNRYRRFFEEHGYVITLMVVQPIPMYTQGIPRHFNKTTKEEFFQKELQHIGQQAVWMSEVAGTGTTDKTQILGYQNRYEEYRRSENQVCGEFRSTLNFWHYGRIFSSNPTLNADFVKCIPTKRVNAVTSTDCLWVMANNSIQARRMVSRNTQSYIK